MQNGFCAEVRIRPKHILAHRSMRRSSRTPYNKAMPAERLYYADSALTRFTATVADIRERSRNGAASLWQVALDRTAFYPTSGGQPYDTGTLRATAPSGAILEAPILEVEEDDQGEVWHLTPKPL